MSGGATPIRSRAARAVAQDNLVRGRSVRLELAGRVSLTQLCVLSLSGRMLEAGEASLLDDLFVSSAAADPRIWPIKSSRVVSAYGDAITGFAALLLAYTSHAIGPMLATRCARLLCAIAQRIEDTGDEPRAVEQELRRRLSAGERLPGFGAPFRPADERVVAFRACLERRAHAPGRWLALTERLADAALRTANLPANIALWCAGLCLDLELDPDQLGPLAAVMLLMSACGVALEGAEQDEAHLRKLPGDCVRYVGAPPRRSPRADAAAGR